MYWTKVCCSPQLQLCTNGLVSSNTSLSAVYEKLCFEHRNLDNEILWKTLITQIVITKRTFTDCSHVPVERYTTELRTFGVLNKPKCTYSRDNKLYIIILLNTIVLTQRHVRIPVTRTCRASISASRSTHLRSLGKRHVTVVNRSTPTLQRSIPLNRCNSLTHIWRH